MKNIILRFHPRESFFPSCIYPQKEHIPAYIAHGTIGKDSTAMTIYLYYTQNLGRPIHPLCPLLGYHEHDIEYITLVHDPENIREVVFSQHTSREASCVPWTECEKTPDGDLIVYVARNSHANYPHAGTYWRIFGFGNDSCSSKGPEIVLSLQDMPTSYDYRFPNGISLHSGIRYPTTPTLSSLQKFFLPLV